MRFSIFCSLALATGCSATQVHGDTLKSRAAFDLECSSAQLQVADLDDQTAGVRGCGRRATYIWTGTTWVMNGASSADELTPAPR
jgi:hypothetical protein